jgi:hypothetical protein
MRALKLNPRTVATAVLLVCAATVSIDAAERRGNDGSSQQQSAGDCFFQTELFPLREQDLTVISADGGVLFEAGMTIDADGAPNAYGPHNRGLDYTANARGAHGWVALVTDRNGHPLKQRRGAYRGYYISTTSLLQNDVDDWRDPKKYVDATKVPYVALPPDFARKYGIQLGDLAVVVNQANGRIAYAVFADVGPKGRIGEGSIALARQLGIPSNPRHDSVPGGVTYLVFPGSSLPAGRRITALRIRSSGARLYNNWGGTERLSACQAGLEDTCLVSSGQCDLDEVIPAPGGALCGCWPGF